MDPYTELHAVWGIEDRRDSLAEQRRTRRLTEIRHGARALLEPAAFAGFEEQAIAEATSSPMAFAAAVERGKAAHERLRAMPTPPPLTSPTQTDLILERSGRPTSSSPSSTPTSSSPSSSPTHPPGADPEVLAIEEMERAGMHFAARDARRALAQREHRLRRRDVEREVASRDRVYDAIRRMEGEQFADEFMRGA